MFSFFIYGDGTAQSLGDSYSYNRGFIVEIL